MKIFTFLLITLIIISSCKNDDKERVEKRIFITSKFNNDLEKYLKEIIDKDSTLQIIPEIKTYDYPKGEINFIFTNDNKIYYHYEDLIDFLCVHDLDKTFFKRTLSADSLHQIKFENIYPFLKNSIRQHRMKNSGNILKPISFSFESDTIEKYDIYKLLESIDSLGFHQYNVRKTAPFEQKAIKEKFK